MRGTVQCSEVATLARDQPVHPRACGEQRDRLRPPYGRVSRFIPAHAGNRYAMRMEALTVINGGSSPRMRGTEPYVRQGQLIIASNGSSPRMRGTGDASPLTPSGTRYGSSPRMRGTAGLKSTLSVSRCWHRFIPAHAGNSSVSSSTEMFQLRRFIPAHAGNRSRATSVQTQHRTGSSPRMRGTAPMLPSTISLDGRFIPAHAGNSP